MKTRTMLGVCLALVFLLLPDTEHAISMKSYRITPQTEPVDPVLRAYSTYNAQTRNHYTLRSYLEKIEAEGGGTLVLSKGVYLSPLRVGVPSNTTIILEDGVIIKKTKETGTPKLQATTSIFDLVPPSVLRLHTTVGTYSGSKNIKIIGRGSAQIDLNYFPRGSAFAIAHNENLYLGGITIRHQQGSHAIELDATKTALIENMHFVDAKMIAGTGPNESINLDTPDPVTKGFQWKWSAQDRTPNHDITIRNNDFTNVNVAIGTHQYSQDRPHTAVRILNNVIDGTKDHAISMMNWNQPVIQYNTIRNVHRPDGKAIAILGRGVVGGSIKQNRLEKIDRAIQFQPHVNYGFKPLYNRFTDKEKLSFRQNEVKQATVNQVVLFSKLGVFSAETSERFNFIP
ncbi:right-handed parallel beta-helix repeat-containing protein [Exiguobacterium sp. RIT594]|uniref:right-handed parallel beta-helix repeat-containing protein n=1 Tax=Exiguobacterium sp. RIT594 TaxID=2282449 RepID=UPI000DF7FC1D|nr:right-handed parallel beta-helix repeat-containing protein [Exiguobacterium sp. RIT594]RDB33482.1 hypothetical protein DVG79_02105 [Exiguobacterium sp. RIT594]